MVRSLITEAPSVSEFTKIPYTPGVYPEGVNFFGYLKAQMGLGQGSRLYASALQHTELPCAYLNIRIGNPAKHNDTEFDGQYSKRPIYNTNLIHVNADQISTLQLIYPQKTWNSRYNIGVWLWELETFPLEWQDAFRYVDEIWAPSSFIKRCLEPISPVPITIIPYGINALTNPTYNRSYFKLPQNQFLFLCMYDVNSVMERKNPLGAINAFMTAFSPNQNDVGLIIKVNNGNDTDLTKIQNYTKEYSNIYLIDRTLTKMEVNSLIECSNAFVSLHRSEGFGLGIAEAMYLGVPAIATNWSANTDFMTEDNSCPVNFRFTDVGDQYFHSKSGQRWAEPNTEHAAYYMKRLFNDSEYRNFISSNAQQFIQTFFSPRASADKMINRLYEIGTVSNHRTLI